MSKTIKEKDKGYSELKKKCSSGLFEHYISLGYCCYVAWDLKEMGLREASLPFDWTRTKWKAIERSYKTHFAGMLEYDCLYQKMNNPVVYKNLDYGIGFFHDFNQYDSLKMQLKAVQEKYNRRIDRLFQYINQPSLFIRYCMNKDELSYIAVHYSEIKKVVKHSNAMNEIAFISDDFDLDVDISNIDYVFFIEKDNENGFNPIIRSSNLYEILNESDYKKKPLNLQFKTQKQEQKINERKKIQSRIKRKLDKMIPKKVYIHDKQC